MTINSALKIIGGVSEPSKMPCHGWSIPAKYCKTGSKLRKVEGSVCSKCYACRGRYTFGAVKVALERRYQALSNPLFVEAFVFFLNRKEHSKFFRWFDSGDLQSVEHLNKIVEICKLTPTIQHWLPTREYPIVEQWVKENGKFPANLIVRLSAYMLEGEPPTALAKRLNVLTSGVSKTGFTCPASNQENECWNCRACWDKSVANINYKQH